MASVTQALEDTIAHLRVALASAEAALTAVLPSTVVSASASASVTASSKPQPPLTPAYDTLSTVSVASSVRAPRQHQLQPQTQPQLQEYQDGLSTVSMMSTASTPRGRKLQNDAWTDNLSRVSAASTVQRSGAAQ